MAYSTIDDPTLYFNTVLYTGTGSEQTVSGVNFSPGLTWLKSRSNGQPNVLSDSVRGGNKQLYTADTQAETTYSQYLKSFNSDGFVLGTDSGINQSSQTFVSWNWKAGGSASNNTDGNKTISLSVNTTAGFSVGTYAGTGQDSTIGHGLGAVPDWLMIKNRSSGSRKWQLWHNGLTGTNKYLAIDRSDAELTDSASWDNTAHSNTVWNTYGSGEANQNGENFVCYAWTSIQGFSDFGSYTGNGNADGPFIYTGFKPAWIMTKQINGGSSWIVHDNKRDPINAVTEYFTVEEPDAAGTLANSFDLCSNGFKVRTSNGDRNSSGDIFAYWAFAESPLVNSEGIPNNAR
tara:strand:+ start:109 stop:1146 length:1038 start_codon:yes stop_codon:yes gene_type:complete